MESQVATAAPLTARQHVCRIYPKAKCLQEPHKGTFVNVIVSPSGRHESRRLNDPACATELMAWEAAALNLGWERQ